MFLFFFSYGILGRGRLSGGWGLARCCAWVSLGMCWMDQCVLECRGAHLTCLGGYFLCIGMYWLIFHDWCQDLHGYGSVLGFDREGFFLCWIMFLILYKSYGVLFKLPSSVQFILFLIIQKKNTKYTYKYTFTRILIY